MQQPQNFATGQRSIRLSDGRQPRGLVLCQGCGRLGGTLVRAGGYLVHATCAPDANRASLAVG